MARTLFTTLAVCALVSCSTRKDPNAPPSAAAGTPSVSSPAPAAHPAAPPATPSTAPAATDLKTSAEKALGSVQPAVAKEVESAKVAAAGAATEAQQVLSKAADSGFSLEALKGALGSLKVDDLKGLADRLTAALNDNQGLAKSVEAQIAKLGITDVAKMGDLKKSLESATALIGQLKDKLGVVVGKLKEHGVDVSKYAALLGG